MFSPISRIHRSRNQGVKKGIASLTTTPRNPLGKFLLPRGVSVLELKVHTSLWPLGASDALKPKAIKGISVWRSGDPNCQGKIGLQLHNGGKKDYVYTVGNPLG